MRTEIMLDCSHGTVWRVRARQGVSFSLETGKGCVLTSESGNQHVVSSESSVVFNKPELEVFVHGDMIGSSRLRIVAGPECLVKVLRLPTG